MDFYSASSLKQVCGTPHLIHYPDFEPTSLCSYSLMLFAIGEATDQFYSPWFHLIQGWSWLENKITEIIGKVSEAIYTLFQISHFLPLLTVSSNYRKTIFWEISWIQLNNWKESSLLIETWNHTQGETANHNTTNAVQIQDDWIDLRWRPRKSKTKLMFRSK